MFDGYLRAYLLIYLFVRTANKVFYGQWSACTLLSAILIEKKNTHTHRPHCLIDFIDTVCLIMIRRVVNKKRDKPFILEHLRIALCCEFQMNYMFINVFAFFSACFNNERSHTLVDFFPRTVPKESTNHYEILIGNSKSIVMRATHTHTFAASTNALVYSEWPEC